MRRYVSLGRYPDGLFSIRRQSQKLMKQGSQRTQRNHAYWWGTKNTTVGNKQKLLCVRCVYVVSSVFLITFWNHLFSITGRHKIFDRLTPCCWDNSFGVLFSSFCITYLQSLLVIPVQPNSNG